MQIIEELTVKTSRPQEIIDITAQVQAAVARCGVMDGVCHVFVPHTTCGLMVNEHADPDVAGDILAALDRIVPAAIPYRHGEGNSAAHVKAALVALPWRCWSIPAGCAWVPGRAYTCANSTAPADARCGSKPWGTRVYRLGRFSGIAAGRPKYAVAAGFSVVIAKYLRQRSRRLLSIEQRARAGREGRSALHSPAYIRPLSIDLACQALEETGAVALAGGTDLLLKLKQETVLPAKLVDLNAIEPLRRLEFGPAGVFLGAALTLARLARSPELGCSFPAVKAAAARVASPQIRSIATLGGNLCQYTRCQYYNQSWRWRADLPTCFKAGGAVCHQRRNSPVCVAPLYSDLAPILAALAARAIAQGPQGERTLPLADLYGPHGTLNLNAGEILAGVAVDCLPPGTGQAFIKTALRGAIDFGLGIVGAVIGVDAAGACTRAAVILGAAAPYPLRAQAAEAALAGQALDAARIAAAARLAADFVPVAEPMCPPAYKKHLLSVLVERALLAAWQAALESRKRDDG